MCIREKKNISYWYLRYLFVFTDILNSYFPMKGLIFVNSLNNRSKGLTMQIYFHSLLWSYLPRVPTNLTTCVYVYLYIWTIGSLDIGLYEPRWRRAWQPCCELLPNFFVCFTYYFAVFRTGCLHSYCLRQTHTFRNQLLCRTSKTGHWVP